METRDTLGVTIDMPELMMTADPPPHPMADTIITITDMMAITPMMTDTVAGLTMAAMTDTGTESILEEV